MAKTLSPSKFAKRTLGLTSWNKLDEIYTAIEEGHRKILVRSCNGAGKTTALAALCLWKLSQFEDCIVLTTASSWAQVTRSLWGEIRLQAKRSDLFPGTDINQSQIKLDDKHFALGISPARPEDAQGFHARHMLIAVDEATGVDPEIMDALSGNMTGKDAQMICIYNPINLSSFPYIAERTGGWKVITISAFEHPNVVEGKEIIKGAVTREWIEDRLEAWSMRMPEGTDADSILIPWTGERWKRTSVVEARILGEWPSKTNDGFIDRAYIMRAGGTPCVPGTRCLGVDVARTGDDRTVIAMFDGNYLADIVSYQGRDLMWTANRIWELHNQGWEYIAIDDTGLGGGVTDRLRELGICEPKLIPVVANASPQNLLQYRKAVNARTEMYMLLEEDLRKERIRLPVDFELEQELLAPRILPDGPNGAYRMEPKEFIKAQLGRSPDKADAIALARYASHLSTYATLPIGGFVHYQLKQS